MSAKGQLGYLTEDPEALMEARNKAISSGSSSGDPEPRPKEFIHRGATMAGGSFVIRYTSPYKQAATSVHTLTQDG
jgi:hypothetical protein